MWIFDPKGFYSITTAKDLDTYAPLPDMLMIRGRVKSHLEGLRERHMILQPYEVLTSPPHRDYAYRIIAPKSVVKAVVAELVQNIEYGNFKNQAHKSDDGTGYANRLMSVWQTMYDLQVDNHGPGKFGGRPRPGSKGAKAACQPKDPFAEFPPSKGKAGKPSPKRGQKGGSVPETPVPKPGLLCEDETVTSGTDKDGAPIVKAKTALGKADESVNPTDPREKSSK